MRLFSDVLLCFIPCPNETWLFNYFKSRPIIRNEFWGLRRIGFLILRINKLSHQKLLQYFITQQWLWHCKRHTCSSDQAMANDSAIMTKAQRTFHLSLRTHHGEGKSQGVTNIPCCNMPDCQCSMQWTLHFNIIAHIHSKVIANILAQW